MAAKVDPAAVKEPLLGGVNTMANGNLSYNGSKPAIEGDSVPFSYKRGNQSDEGRRNYFLRTLNFPKSVDWKKTVVLHCDRSACPYMLSDFVEPLKDIINLKLITQLGSSIVNYVYLLSLENEQAANRVLQQERITVNGKPCFISRAGTSDVVATIHWLPAEIPNDLIKQQYVNCGVVKSIEMVRSKTPGLEHVLTNSRKIIIETKPNISLSDIPYLIRVLGMTGSVTITGRPPLCYRCKKPGHIRKDCTFRKCPDCGKSGHEDGACVKVSYASKARGMAGDAEINFDLIADDIENYEEGVDPSIHRNADGQIAPKQTISSDTPKPMENSEKPAISVSGSQCVKNAKDSATPEGRSHSEVISTIDRATFKHQQSVRDDCPKGNDASLMQSLTQSDSFENSGSEKDTNTRAVVKSDSGDKSESSWKIDGRKRRRRLKPVPNLTSSRPKREAVRSGSNVNSQMELEETDSDHDEAMDSTFKQDVNPFAPLFTNQEEGVVSDAPLDRRMTQDL